MFTRASDRIRRRFEPRFPHVHPHRLRHSFALATLERLVSGYYAQAAGLVTATGSGRGPDAALALYLAKADPMMVLRDLLGHSSVVTTEAYLRRLDMTRIYADAYERAGRDAGLTGAAACARPARSSRTRTALARAGGGTDAGRAAEGPAGISCVFSDGRRYRRIVAAEPAALVRDLLAGLAGLVHPHGSVDSPGTVIAYVQGIADIARFMRERGVDGGAAQLSRGLLAEYWMQAGGIQESVTRRMLASFDAVSGGRRAAAGSPRAGRRASLQGQAASPRWSPTPRRNGAGCTRPAADDVDEAFARHRQAVKPAARGQDPRDGGWTAGNQRWLLMRLGPLSDRQAGAYLGCSATWVTRRGGIRAASEELFPGVNVVIAYRLLLGIYTGIVPDGIAGLGIGDIDWAGDASVLLAYVKGRTAAEIADAAAPGGAAAGAVAGALRPGARARSRRAARQPVALLLLWRPGHAGRPRPGSSTHDAVGTPARAERGPAQDPRRPTCRCATGPAGTAAPARRSTRTTAPAVEGDHYLTAATPAQREALDTIIEDAQHDLLSKAHPPVVLADEDAAELAAGYPGLVAGLNLDDAAIAGLLSGEQDVFVAACADPLSGLHGPPGKPCPARPWVCLLCPLAVFTPRHAANLLRLKAFFARQWTQMPSAQFMAVFGPYFHPDHPDPGTLPGPPDRRRRGRRRATPQTTRFPCARRSARHDHPAARAHPRWRWCQRPRWRRRVRGSRIPAAPARARRHVRRRHMALRRRRRPLRADEQAGQTRLDFTAISDPRWRLAAKEYLFARLAPGHPEIAVLPRAFRVP